MVPLIRATHPNTTIIALPVLEKLQSVLRSLDSQVVILEQYIEQAKKEHQFSEHHLICHSQGGLTCRGYVQSCNTHNVRNLITLSAPHMVHTIEK